MARKQALVLMQYPITESHRAMIADVLEPDLDFLVISTIAAQGYLGLLRKLRSSRYEHVYVLIADQTAIALVSILIMVAACVPAKRRYLLHQNNRLKAFTFIDCLIASLKVLGTICLGLVYLAQVLVRIKWLLQCPRIKITSLKPVENKHLYYFRTNLWLGVQAGGALTHTRGIVNAIAKAGWQVFYFSAELLIPRAEGKIKFVPCLPRNTYVIPRELNHILYNRGFLKAAIASMHDAQGVIYQRSSIGNFCGIEASRQLKLPLVVEYNGSEGWLSRNWGTPYFFSGLIESVEQAMLQHAHLVVTVSEQLRDELLARGISNQNILVHPNGVDLSIYSPKANTSSEADALRLKLGIPTSATVVTFVGTFGPWHGAEILATAANYLLQNEPDLNLFFLFIGDGVRRSEVEKITSDYIDSKQVILTGLIISNEVPLYLNASDILVAPTVENPDKSPFFGSPTKLFEYMASGRLIIASGLGQISDVLEGSAIVEQLPLNDGVADNGQCGIIVNPGSVGDLEKAIKYAVLNPVWRKTAGQNALKRVQANYTWDHHVDELFKNVEGVILRNASEKICVLINAIHSKSGGGLTYLKNVLPYLKQDPRLDVHICIHQAQRNLFHDYLDGVTCHEFNFKLGFWRLLVREQMEIPLLARKIGAHVTFSPANYGPILLSKSVLLLRNSLGVAHVERRMIKLLYWAMLYLGTAASILRASSIIAVSEYARSEGAGTLSTFSRRSEIIPHGINPIFEPQSFLKRSETELLLVADIYVQKNIHTLLTALPRILERHPNMVLRIAGNAIDHEYADSLNSIIVKLGLAEHVHFLGSVDLGRLVRLYQQCTLFVFPSTVETFGNPLVEAMACGAPIACSNSAAMPEIAGDGVTYFDPYDEVNIAKVINQLLENPKLRESLGQKANERAKRYSWSETAHRTTEVLINAAKS